MSTLTSREVLNPENKTDICPVFTIDNKQRAFGFTNITVAGNEYTLSFWAKSDTTGGISINGSSITITDVWTRHIITYTAERADLILNFETAGTYYIYHPQLENGNKATDWRPALEDTDDKISGIQIGGRNLIRQSANLSLDNYYFSGAFVTVYNGAGDLAVICGASASDDGAGNVTMRTSATVSYDGNGNVTIV